ncbi:hypothetical protein BC830DRAFT_645861 [Chytriomyces sp. MP71]|nr:hypothetical protein BC830DRAFT_645861 [Chytriomyces sp. MP71]
MELISANRDARFILVKRVISSDPSSSTSSSSISSESSSRSHSSAFLSVVLSSVKPTPAARAEAWEASSKFTYLDCDSCSEVTRKWRSDTASHVVLSNRFTLLEFLSKSCFDCDYLLTASATSSFSVMSSARLLTFGGMRYNHLETQNLSPSQLLRHDTINTQISTQISHL